MNNTKMQWKKCELLYTVMLKMKIFFREFTYYEITNGNVINIIRYKKNISFDKLILFLEAVIFD